jgi:hypothetical protein
MDLVVFAFSPTKYCRPWPPEKRNDFAAPLDLENVAARVQIEQTRPATPRLPLA